VQLVGSPKNARHFLAYAFLKLMMSAYNCRSVIQSVLVSSPLFVLVSRRSLLPGLFKMVLLWIPLKRRQLF